MWKCERCNKENQDSAQQCTNCDHGQTMDYIHHRSVSKLCPEIMNNWKKKKQKPTLIADCMEDKRETVLGSKVLRKEICEIEFVRMDLSNIPKGAWDVSADRSRTIWAWTNTGTEGLSLKIGSENGVYANPNCQCFFYEYINLETIHFHDFFDTSHVTDMFMMFNNCRKLKSLDVSGFETANVTNMREMFANCRSMKKLDTSNFYFREDVKTEDMFLNCGTERTEAPHKYPLTQNSASVVRVLKTYEDNWHELKKRKIHRIYTGSSIKEICEKFLSYEANQKVNNMQVDSSELMKNLQIYQNHNIYILHDDTWRKNGQSGFAVTEQGIYTKALFKNAKFIPWKEFKECELINISGDSELSAGKNCIAFLSGDRDTLLELELMFAAIHEYLNQKPVSKTKKKEKPTLMQDSSNKSWIVTNVFGKSILRENIHEIEFIKTTKAQVPSRAWDVSADQSNTIWAWVTARPQGTTLYIGSENGVYANPTCERLFMAYTNVKRIKFNNLFDTSRVEDMEDMFSYCRNLEEIDVSGFDTSKVVFMQSMFEECRKLKTLDTSNFRYKENVITDDMFKNSGITR